MVKKTILVVEDELEIQKFIIKKLEDGCFSVVAVKTVDEALDVLSENKIDALWLDHYLFGEKSGFDLVVELKSNEKLWGKIPVFVVSNTAGPDDIQSYLELGITKYFVKSNATLGQIVDELKMYFEGNAVT
ncbi:MAG: Two component transcriptional regulator, winged helix family [Candidatus Moranbacteria bacterium GW2011_GWA2_39_41]|nr:MAG: Two component transcriptional regulator, winged helix family [Candidatus Moranbacteria bacterium GW2011_GWA2_39_41]